MRPFFAMAAALAAVGGVHAAPITFGGDTANSTSNLGNYTGSLDYSYSAGVGTITVGLTNTSPLANGGYLTAFAFNLPTGYGSLTAGMSYVGPGGTSYGLIGGSGFVNDINVQPFGNADIGASTGGSWEGGGPPSDGLAVGQSGTWTFTLSGDNAYLSGLTASGIFNTITQPQGGSGTDNFLVRFRGFENGGSDKVPAGSGGGGNGGGGGGDGGGGGGSGDPDPTTTPEPATMLTLAALGGMGLIGYRLRRKKA